MREVTFLLGIIYRRINSMASMSGNAKLRRAANQLENAERLLLGLPKHFYKDPKRREALEKLAKDIFIIKQSIEKAIAWDEKDRSENVISWDGKARIGIGQDGKDGAGNRIVRDGKK
jgi:hypothetical protein